MKVGDLVRMKEDDILGLIMKINNDADPSIDRCWYVFFAIYGNLPMWEHELEVVSESACK